MKRLVDALYFLAAVIVWGFIFFMLFYAAGVRL